MSKFTVKNCLKTGERQTDFGQMADYALSLADPNGNEIGCTWSRKVTSPAPSGEIEGDIEETKWGKKFKQAKGSFGSFGGGGAKANPREHAQEMALRYCEIQATLGAITSLSKEALLPLVDWFAKDATGGSTSPAQTFSAPQPTMEQTRPEDAPEIDISEFTL